MSAVGAARAAQHAAGSVARELSRSRLFERLARSGYAARGALYITVGVLAVRMATGSPGHAPSQRGALETLAEQPFGQVLLGVVAVGLAGLALFRLVEATLDPGHLGTDAKGIAKRVGRAFTAVVYGGLTMGAVRLLTGSGGETDAKRGLTARVLAEPWGAALVVAVGAILVVVALVRAYRGLTRRFARDASFDVRDPRRRELVERLGQVGLTAHGAVLAIVGGFVASAGLRSDATEVRGLDGALAELAAQPFGTALLVVAAVGLGAFGVYSLALARYKRIP